jgi:hypothetical protein
LVIVAGVWLNLKSDIPLPEKYSNENFGQYGDSFGALTSLFTALGLSLCYCNKDKFAAKNIPKRGIEERKLKRNMRMFFSDY